MPEKCETLEELSWMPGLEECDIIMYMRAARSMAAFAGMCDGGSAEDGRLAASRDDTTINALQLLHESNYDTNKALQALVKSPVPKGIEKKWTEEEQKRFVKGLRLYGKNFFKIRKELLSHKETPDLVEYYYLWKKTPQAATARPHRRHRRCVLRRIRNSSNGTNNNTNSQKNSTANNNNKEDVSSASEEEADQTDDSDSNINSDLMCSNCGTLAKELHQTGKDRSLLCNECRNYLKKFGEHRPVGDKDILPKTGPNKADEEGNFSNGKPNLRTRKGKEKISKYDMNRGNSKSSETSSPERNDQNLNENSCNDSKSNGTAVIENNEIKAKNEIPKKRHFSSIENDDLKETSNNAIEKDGESEIKHRKLTPTENGTIRPEDNEDTVTDLKESKIEDSVKVENSDKEMKSVIKDAEICQIPKEETNTIENNVDIKNEVIADSEKEQIEETEKTLDNVTSGGDDTEEPPNKIVGVKEDVEDLSHKKVENESTDLVENNEKDKVEMNLINLKLEPPTSPQDLSFLSTRERDKTLENVPSTNSQTSTSLTMSNSSSAPASIKKEDGIALNFSTPSAKASPSSSPNPSLLFPFSQISPSVPSSMADRFPYLMPPLNFGPGVGLPPDASKQQVSIPTTNEKHEVETKTKDDQIKSNESSSNKIPPTSKAENIRSLQSPKTTSSTTYSAPPPHFTSAANDPFLMSHPSFAPHLAAGGDRLPFPNPMMNYPPGFPAHIPGLPTFMSPWSQYAARLPPGAFPPPFLQHSGSQMSSHSPHSQIKSKSPITSQSSSHHSSPSHFSSHSIKTHENKENFERRDRESYQQEEDDMDNSYLSRGPSPEPKIEDSECHRSQSAIFLRHWNRGDYNSCARTDLTFKPVPESQLSRKREERARKVAEKEREDHKKSEKPLPVETKQPSNHSQSQSSSNHENSSHISPLGGRHTPRNFDTPALRQLTEYARPHSTYSPFSHPSMAHHMVSSNIPLGLHGPTPPGGSSIDQITFAQLMLKERIEAEEKQKLAMLEKQKEIELKSRTVSQAQHNNAMPSTSSANSIFDQHLLEMQRRLASSAPGLANSPSLANNPNTSTANGLPLPGSNPTPINPFMLFSTNDRAAQEQMQQMAVAAAAADRFQADRLALSAATDPLFRLQMGLNPDIHGNPGGPSQAHAFQHPSHSVHPGSHSSSNSSAENAAAAAASMQLASAAAAMGLQGTQFDPALHAGHPLLQSTTYPSRPPSIMPRAELNQPSSLYRSFEDHLSHQLSAQAFSAQALQHEQLQRQLMMERERLMAAHHLNANSQHQQMLQEEFIRQRELKFRSLEEAARNGGRPM